MQQNNSSKIVTGVIWSGLQRFGVMFITFISNVVLARLLTPDDFGTVGMLLLFITIANTFVDSGFGSALIQKKNPTQKDYSTVFYINLTISLVLYGVLFLVAPIIANFYKLDILCPILRIEGVYLLFNAFCLIPTTRLRKQLDFKKLSIVNIAANMIGTIAAIIMAYYGMGVWSLVVRMLMVSLLTAGLLWTIDSWKPLLSFSWESCKSLFDFGGFILLSSIVSTIANNVQTMIIGRLLTPSVLGNYTQAKNLRDIPSMSISQIICQVLYPDFSNNQDDNEKIASKLNFGIYLLSYVTCLVMGVLIVIAKPLIIIVYSNRWLEAIPYFQILCIGGVFIALQDINYYVLAAKGYSKKIFHFNALLTTLSVVLMIVGGKLFGINGLLLVMVLSALMYYLLYAYLGTKAINITVWPQLKELGKSILLATVCSLIVYFVFSVFTLSNVATVLLECTLFAVLAIGLSAILKLGPYQYIVNMIFKRKGKENN